MNCNLIGGLLVFLAMLVYSIPFILAYITIISLGNILLIGLGSGLIGTMILIAGAACLEIASDD